MDKYESQNIEIHETRVIYTVEQSVVIVSFQTTVTTIFEGTRDGRDYNNTTSDINTPAASDNQYAINRLMPRWKLSTDTQQEKLQGFISRYLVAQPEAMSQIK